MITLANKVPSKIVYLWMAWCVFILGYQAFLVWYFPELQTQGLVEYYSEEYEEPYYLTVKFLPQHVAWDTEYYVSIAVGGYDDPLMRRVETPSGSYSWNYAFLPLYPLAIRLFSFPFVSLGFDAVATAIVVGIGISLLGTLVGCLSLYDLLQQHFSDSESFRGVLYLLFFPSAYFLAQVYTEGLFIGLFWGSLALIRHKSFVWASIVIACATVTRAVGGILLIPLFLGIIDHIDLKTDIFPQITREMFFNLVIGLLPLLFYMVWRTMLGEGFDAVQEYYFHRGLFLFEQTFRDFLVRELDLYFVVETFTVCFACVSCIAVSRKFPMIALISLCVIVISVPSGVFQSMTRYLLPAPSIYFFLVEIGKHKTFRVVWLGFSVLAFLSLAFLFAFDFLAI